MGEATPASASTESVAPLVAPATGAASRSKSCEAGIQKEKSGAWVGWRGADGVLGDRCVPTPGRRGVAIDFQKKIKNKGNHSDPPEGFHPAHIIRKPENLLCLFILLHKLNFLDSQDGSIDRLFFKKIARLRH